MLRNSWQLVKFGSLLYCVNTYVFEVTMCVGPSMLPTFSSAGDIVLVEHLTPLFGQLKRGDIVIAQSPSNPRQTVCKRIKALAGDERQGEPVPTGRVWLEGDNPKNSTDSRSYGPVPLAMVKGKVYAQLWPPHKIGRLRSAR